MEKKKLRYDLDIFGYAKLANKIQCSDSFHYSFDFLSREPFLLMDDDRKRKRDRERKRKQLTFDLRLHMQSLSSIEKMCWQLCQSNKERNNAINPK